MKGNDEHLTFKIGVENLLSIDQNIDVPSFYKQRTKTDNYGAQSILKVFKLFRFVHFYV